MSLRATCDFINGIYAVDSNETNEAARTAGRANSSPDRKHRIIGVATVYTARALLRQAKQQ